MRNVEAYGTGGLEYIDQNTPIANLRNSEFVKEIEFRNSVRRYFVSEIKKEALVSHKTLTVKVLETKINKVIVDSNVKTLSLIYGKTNVSYGNNNELNNYYQGGQTGY